MELLLAAVPAALAIGYYLGHRMRKTELAAPPPLVSVDTPSTTSWEIDLRND